VTAAVHASHKRFDRDVAWSAFAMLVPIAVGLVGLPIIFRNVGETVFSLFLLSYGAINFAPSLDLGVARTAQRRIAYANSVHPEDQRLLVRHSLRRALTVAILAGLAVAVLGLILFPAAGGGRPLGLAMVTGVGVGVAIYANTQRGVLEGLGAFSRSALNRAGVGVLLIGASLAASFVVRDAAVISLASLLVRFPFVWEQARAIRTVMDRRSDNPDAAREDVAAGFMRESGWFALLALLAVSMSGFDRYILIAWGGLGSEALTVFLATQDMALRAIALPTALLPALMVRLAASANPATARQLSNRLFIALQPPVIIGCLGIAWLREPIAAILYPGLARAETAASISILLFGVAGSAIAQFPMTRLVAAGRARDAAVMHLLEFALYLALAPFVIGRFGAPGAAALWSGRIWLDTVLLIGWSGIRRAERSAAAEAVLLAASGGSLSLLWWLT
jgi:O-antigen/teichoic acid export membrane protein